MARKAESLSLSTIVVAAICIIVLIVLAIIFATRIGLFGRGIEDCKSKGGEVRHPGDDTAGLACTPAKYDKQGNVVEYCCLTPFGSSQVNELKEGLTIAIVASIIITSLLISVTENTGIGNAINDLNNRVSSTGEVMDSCADNDEGLKYTYKGTVSGTATGSAYSYSDSCSSTSTVVEYYCEKELVQYIKKECSAVVGTGYVCTDGACVLEEKATPTPTPANSCKDNDEGLKYTYKGTVSGVTSDKPYVYEDYCSDSRTIVEYYCEKDYAQAAKDTCEVVAGKGYVCKDGACIWVSTATSTPTPTATPAQATPTPTATATPTSTPKPTPTDSCTETDGGFNPHMGGKVSGMSSSTSYTYEDKCDAQGLLTEWYCKSEAYTSTIVDCTKYGDYYCAAGYCVQGKKTEITDGKIIFVTEKAFKGDLGGLASADAKCNEAAQAAGLPGTYKAWLSSSTVSATSRLAHSQTPYIRPDGVVVAYSWDDLIDGQLLNPIAITETGAYLARYVWTASTIAGVFSDYDCKGWTSALAADYGSAGLSYFSTNYWTGYSKISCSWGIQLYCVQQDSVTAAAPTPTLPPDILGIGGLNCAADTDCNDNDRTTLDTCMTGQCAHTLQACAAMNGTVCAACSTQAVNASDTPLCCLTGCTTCQDSDGGINPRREGEVINGTDTYPDLCVFCPSPDSPEEECIAVSEGMPGNTVFENYCTNGTIAQQRFDCACAYDETYTEYLGMWGYCIDDVAIPEGVCGDAICMPPEDIVTCPLDCTTMPLLDEGQLCGDLVCIPPETLESCPQDCSIGEPRAGEEDGQTYPDEGVEIACGNSLCDAGEQQSCPQDCIIEPVDCQRYQITLEEPLDLFEETLYILEADEENEDRVLLRAGREEVSVHLGEWYDSAGGKFYVSSIHYDEEGIPTEVEVQTCECSDGTDNDQDGTLDFGNDVGCFSYQDNTENDDCLANGEKKEGRNSKEECCSDLKFIRGRQSDLPWVVGYCTDSCGDYTCDNRIEDSYNCPLDCGELKVGDQIRFKDVLKELFGKRLLELLSRQDILNRKTKNE